MYRSPVASPTHGLLFNTPANTKACSLEGEVNKKAGINRIREEI